MAKFRNKQANVIEEVKNEMVIAAMKARPNLYEPIAEKGGTKAKTEGETKPAEPAVEAKGEAKTSK